LKLPNKTETIYPQNCIVKSNKFFSKGKFNWTALNIKWFLDAEETTNFYEDAIQIMKSYTKDSKTVIDIGCGIGTFSIGLAKEGLNVTAIDTSPIVISAFEDRIKNKSIENIETFSIPFELLSNKNKYDIVLMSYMMGLINENNIEQILNLSNKYVILILPSDSIKDDFSISELYKKIGLDIAELKQQTYKEIVKVFDKLKINYDVKIFQSEFGQPFDSKKEACNFIKYYFNIPISYDIELTNWIEEKLIVKNNRYYLQNNKKSTIVLIKK